MLVRVRGVGWGAAAGLRFVAVVLVSGLLVAVAVLGSRATARVAAVLDENWRGSYDILITAPGQGFSAVATGGLVDSNFVATAGEGGISVADLARIRAIAGVEVAAPIGMVGSLRQQAFTPFLFVRDDVDYGQEITEPLVSAMPSDDLLMRVTATTVLLAADGSDEQVVSQGTGRVWLRARPKGELWDFEVVYGLGSSMGFMPIVQGTGFRVPLGALPTFASSVLAVDPVAEAQLWGDEYAVFLEPLAELSESSAAPTGREVSDAWVDFMCRGSGVTPGVGFPCSLQSSMINTAVREAENTETAPALVVPLVVNQGAGRDLVLRVEVAVTDQDVSGKDLDQSFLDTLTNADFVPYSVSELDVSAVTSPFSSPDLMVLLPGSQPAGNDWGVFATETALTPMLVGRPDYETVVAPSGEVAFEVVPGDVVGSDGLTMQESGMAEWGMDIGVGLVRAYRSTVKTGAATGALPAPLGVFSLDVLVDPNAGDVSYVPVGYSSQVDTWQVLDSGERLPVLANLSGVDFITMAPGAFTDLLGGAALRGATPIDAIRVRVAGITGYTPEAQQRIIDVAEQIELLGLDATVVAGSSPQSVSLFVSDYFVDRSEMATDLGWVSQEWSSLGASVTVETALSGTVLMLVGVALLAGAVGMVVCAVTSAKGLRFSVGILRVIGWRERRILRLVAGELAPASLLVAVMGVGCFMWVPYQLRSLFAAGVVFAGVLFGAETVAALRPTRVRSGTSRDGEPVLSLRGVALRLLRSRAVWVGLIVVGVSLVAVLTTLGVVVVREGRERAGATRLAEFAFSATGSLTLGIEVLGVGAAILLLVLAHRMERLQAAGDTAVFNAVGFTLAAQAVIARWQEFLVAVGCAIAGLVVVSVVSVMFAGGWVAWLAGVGALVLVMMLRFVSSSNKTEVIR